MENSMRFGKTLAYFCSMGRRAVWPHIFNQANLSSTPQLNKGSHQVAGGVPAPREFHPR